MLTLAVLLLSFFLGAAGSETEGTDGPSSEALLTSILQDPEMTLVLQPQGLCQDQIALRHEVQQRRGWLNWSLTFLLEPGWLDPTMLPFVWTCIGSEGLTEEAQELSLGPIGAVASWNPSADQNQWRTPEPRLTL